MAFGTSELYSLFYCLNFRIFELSQILLNITRNCSAPLEMPSSFQLINAYSKYSQLSWMASIKKKKKTNKPTKEINTNKHQYWFLSREDAFGLELQEGCKLQASQLNFQMYWFLNETATGNNVSYARLQDFSQLLNPFGIRQLFHFQFTVV